MQAALAASAASSVLGGVGALREAQGEKMRANINSYIARTRALQTSTTARENANSEMSTLLASMAANGQTGGMSFFRELMRVREREHRIAVENENQTARDYKMQGQNAMASGRLRFLSAGLKAVSPLYDIYQLRTR